MADFVTILPVALITSDATPTTVFLFNVGSNSVGTADLYLAAIAEDGTSWGAQVSRVFKKVANADAVLVGAQVTILNQRDLGAATWAATLGVSGSDLVITATGQAGVTIHWGFGGTVLLANV